MRIIPTAAVSWQSMSLNQDAADKADCGGVDDSRAACGADAGAVSNGGSASGCDNGDGHMHKCWFCRPCKFKKGYLEDERRKLECLRTPVIKAEQESGKKNEADGSFSSSSA